VVDLAPEAIVEIEVEDVVVDEEDVEVIRVMRRSGSQ
jgi:hypothetical protein